MKLKYRTVFSKTLFLLIILLSVIKAQAIFVESANSKSLHKKTNTNVFRKEPYLIFTGNQAEMEVLWQLYQTDICNFEWGENTDYGIGNVTTYEYGDDHQHKYTITGLDLNSVYYYRVIVSGDTITGNFKSIMGSTGSTLKFIAYGDTRSQPNYHNEVAHQILTELGNNPADLSFVVFSGDFVNNGDHESDWDNQFFSSNYGNIRQLMQNSPYLATVGNHEGNGILFEKYFPYPFYNQGKYYWSFDYGPAHFTIVDQFTLYSEGSPQYQWLVNDLSSSNKRWKFVLLHKPGWSAGGGHPNNTDVQNIIQPLCVQYGVQFVIGGHNHYYACAVVDNVIHITSGGGGAPLYNPDISFPDIIKVAKDYHFCSLTMDENNLFFKAIDKDGQILHQFDYNSLITGVEIKRSVFDLQISPNPFKKITNINFNLKKSDRVKVSVYNNGGNLVRVISNSIMNAGKNKLFWDGTNSEEQKVNNGVYYIIVEIGDIGKITRKIIVVQ